MPALFDRSTAEECTESNKTPCSFQYPKREEIDQIRCITGYPSTKSIESPINAGIILHLTKEIQKKAPNKTATPTAPIRSELSAKEVCVVICPRLRNRNRDRFRFALSTLKEHAEWGTLFFCVSCYRHALFPRPSYVACLDEPRVKDLVKDAT